MSTSKKSRAGSQRRGLLGIPVPAESDDEDYVPGPVLRQGSPTEIKRNHKKQARKPPRPKRVASNTIDALDVPLALRMKDARSRTQRGPRCAPTANCEDWGSLPVDLLGTIFMLAARHGALPTAPAVSKVCRIWREAARSHPEIWSCLDLSSARTRLPPPRALAAGPHWAQVREVVLSGWTPLHPPLLAALGRHCPLVTSFSLSGANPVPEAALREALQAWPHLSCISLNDVLVRPRTDPIITPLLDPPTNPTSNPTSPSSPTPPAPTRTLTSSTPTSPTAAAAAAAAAHPTGPLIQRLVLRMCPSVGTTLLKTLSPPPTAHPTPGTGPLGLLLELDLSHSGARPSGRLALHIERLQHAAPLLETLKLTGLGSSTGWQLAPRGKGFPEGGGGFPRLRSCWLGVHAETGGYTLQSHMGASFIRDEELQRICGRSPLLHELELTGTGVTWEVLRELPGKLRTLLITKTLLASDQGLETIAELYAAEVEEVQAGGAGNWITSNGVGKLGGCGKLRVLDVSGSTVDTGGLRRLLAGPAGLSLQHLDIASCRSVERPVRASAAAGGLPALRQALGL